VYGLIELILDTARHPYVWQPSHLLSHAHGKDKKDNANGEETPPWSWTLKMLASERVIIEPMEGVSALKIEIYSLQFYLPTLTQRYNRQNVFMTYQNCPFIVLRHALVILLTSL
jgi:hypothetical protein